MLEKCSQQLNVSIFTRNTPTQGLSTLRFYTFSSFSVGCCINKENIIYYLSSETTYIDVLKLPVFDLHALHASKRMTIVAHATNLAACFDGEIKLVGGTSDSEGRVEVCLNGQWGTVCHDFWGSVDAQVACRQLGFSATGMLYYITATIKTKCKTALIK